MKKRRVATPAIPLPDAGPWQVVVINDVVYLLSPESGLYRLNKVTNKLDAVVLT